ncbi:hypothetical protein BTVI_62669 [Pitangus sulphuratus]|nr:hypothetical protein BTVI_62669 [Pitangus sulphuratus]
MTEPRASEAHNFRGLGLAGEMNIHQVTVAQHCLCPGGFFEKAQSCHFQLLGMSGNQQETVSALPSYSKHDASGHDQRPVKRILLFLALQKSPGHLMSPDFNRCRPEATSVVETLTSWKGVPNKSLFVMKITHQPLPAVTQRNNEFESQMCHPPKMGFAGCPNYLDIISAEVVLYPPTKYRKHAQCVILSFTSHASDGLESERKLSSLERSYPAKSRNTGKLAGAVRFEPSLLKSVEVNSTISHAGMLHPTSIRKFSLLPCKSLVPPVRAEEEEEEAEEEEVAAEEAFQAYGFSRK